MIKKLILVTVTILILLIAVSCKNSKENDDETANNGLDKTYNVNTTKPEYQEIDIMLTASGTAQPDQEVEIKTGVSGVIDSIHFDEGDYIEKGDLLVKVDVAKYQLRVDQADAAFAQAKAGFENAKLELERKRILFEKNAISQGMFDGIKTQYEAAKAGYEMAEANLKYARLSFQDAQLKSPLSGYVKSRMNEAGEYVDPMFGGPMLTVIKTDPIRVKFTLPEKYAGDIKKGHPIDVKFTSVNDKTFKGKISIVSPAVDQMTRTISLQAEIANPKNVIKAGSFAEISLVISSDKKSLVIPTKAILSEQGSKYAYKVVNNVIEKTAIEIGATFNGFTEVINGLNVEDTIVSDGISSIHDGAKVQTENSK